MKCSDKESLINIIYLDNHILVADKPANLLTQPDDTDKENLQDLLKAFLKKKFNKKGQVFLHCVHRLDKPVSGLVLFARTSKALSRLNKEVREKKLIRVYFAVVEGYFKQKKGVLEHFLVHGEYKAQVFDEKCKDAKIARLEFKVLKQKDDKSWIEVKLETGRYHQIRAQFAHVGHPIVGDSKYGSSFKSKIIKLHHGRVEFIHPVLKKKMIFKSSSNEN